MWWILGLALWSYQCSWSFQALVTEILRDFLNQFIFVELDYILFFSKSQKKLVGHICQVVQRLLQHQLFVKAKKCEFLPVVYYPSGMDSNGSESEGQHYLKHLTGNSWKRFLSSANFYSYFYQSL